MTESLRVTNMWQELISSGVTSDKSTLVNTCEHELAELMRQIDLMVAQKKAIWQQELSALNNHLSSKDREIIIHKTVVQQKNNEIQELRDQAEKQDKKQEGLIREYETQLANVKAQVNNMKKEYENLQKRYSKHSKHKQKDDKITNKSMSTPSKETEDLKRENHKHLENIKSLEDQNKSLYEKYRFLEQQSQTYENQLERRREILSNTEARLQAKVKDTEEKLTKLSQVTITQETQINNLKKCLEESLANHRRTLADKNKLQHLYSETRAQLQKFNKELSQCQLQKESAVNQLEAIKANKQSQDQQIIRLQNVEEAKNMDIEGYKIQEKKLMDEINELKQQNNTVKQQTVKLNEEITLLLENRVTTDKQEQKIDRLQKELERTKLDLNEKNTLYGKRADDFLNSQKQLLDLQHTLQRREAEVQVVNSQLDALRIENRNLRQTALQTESESHQSKNHKKQLLDLEKAYTTSIKTLEEQNVKLTADIETLQDRIKKIEEETEIKLKTAIKNTEQSLQKSFFEKEQRLVEQKELECEKMQTSQRQQDVINTKLKKENVQLHQQVNNLKQQLDNSNLTLQRIEMEHSAMSSFVSGVNNVITQPSDLMVVHNKLTAGIYNAPSLPQSPLFTALSPSLSSHSPVSAHTSVCMSDCDHQHLPLNTLTLPPTDGNGEPAVLTQDNGLGLAAPVDRYLSLLALEDDEVPESIDDVVARFKADQERRTQELQEKLDRNIQSFRQKSDETMLKYKQLDKHKNH